MVDWRNREQVKAYQKAYRKRPEVNAKVKAYHQKPEIKAKAKAYHQKPEIKAKAKAYLKSPVVLERLEHRRFLNGLRNWVPPDIQGEIDHAIAMRVLALEKRGIRPKALYPKKFIEKKEKKK